MWDFEHGAAGKLFEISYTVPSRCAAELEKGTADIGIIPSAAYVTIPGLVILPGVAIASKQAVRSILLVSRKSLDQIETVALDSSSITSACLARILFEKYWGGKREYRSLSPDLELMLAEHDAALLIGDPALKINRSQYQTWDLAEEWIRFTNKPFVFAFWAVREDAIKRSVLDLAQIFQQSRDHGLEPANLSQISRNWATKIGLDPSEIHDYLTANIFYYLDEDCLSGLSLFYRYGHDCGALPSVPELQFRSYQPALT